MARQKRNVLLILAFCLVIFFALNLFLGYRRSRDPVRLREQMASAAAQSCRASPELKLAGTPEQVVSYCNCTVDSELGSMSDAQIIAAAQRGTPDAQDRAKMTEAAFACRSRLRSAR